ncbi:GntR family transcriptional regulator [Consotaella salsifontis]|uniref:Transcriptional regulator, GntR family n=1 Tax=Consotaella salsifontis TaxID=1365950 RepID=A0A1T4Q1Q3_9HYPH|nr:GntR family transcriptional regulator [Consotaella salsifontis]SJZ97526.1 transcriptional regulator, GntR family [Consotaella salsifontis]
MDFRIDRDLQVPIRLQLKGVIEYGIACGELLVGDPLPSVRDLAEQAGVAPMTVSLVYRDLKSDGLIETRPGAGTYVADSSQARMAARPSVVALHRQIDGLIDQALKMGIRSADVSALFNARLNYRLSLGRRFSVVMVGMFPEATTSYARFIAARLGSGATVEPVTLDDIQRSRDLRDRTSSADLALTFANRHREVSALLPATKVVSIRFIPSEATRLALASLDPMSSIVVVSLFPDFLPILKSGVQRFAAHVQTVAATNLDDPALADMLKQASVVVYSTGADRVMDRAPEGLTFIEYRHTPDPGDIERLVMPLIVQSTGHQPDVQKEAS